MHKIIFGNQEVKVSGLVVTANMFILIFLFSLFLAGCGSEEKKETNIERSASVKVFKVKKGDIASWISATGTLAPCQESRIGPKVEGRIEKIYADVGDRVKKGQPLIKLEQKTYIIAKNEAEAALKTAQSYLIKAEVNLKNIAKDYKRISSLWREKVISEQRYDKITTDYTAARAELNLAGARVKEAEASLDLAEDHLRETVIYAPFSGFVVEKHMERGEVSNWVTYLWNVLHLVDISKVKIECPIYETKLAFLQAGKKVAVAVDAYPGEVFPGKIAVINPKVDPKSRTFLVKIKIPNPDFRLRGGMFCRVKIPEQEKEDVLWIPKEALLVKAEKHIVFKVENNKAISQIVKLGISDGSRVEITEGLKEGEQVVIEGLYALTDGIKTEIMP